MKVGIIGEENEIKFSDCEDEGIIKTEESCLAAWLGGETLRRRKCRNNWKISN